MKNKLTEALLGTLFITYLIYCCFIVILPIIMIVSWRWEGHSFEWYEWASAIFLMLLTMGSSNVCMGFFIENMSTVEGGKHD